jgi:hypothetical protein
LAKIPGDQCSDFKNIFVGKIGLKGVINTASLRKKLIKSFLLKNWPESLANIDHNISVQGGKPIYLSKIG